MERLTFTFNNQNSLADYGIVLAKWPQIPTAQRSVHYVDIPGRDSSIWYDEGTYQDKTILVECRVAKTGGEADLFADQLDDIADWLYDAGESDLTFSFQPERVHRAQVVNAFDFQVIRGVVAAFPVVFTCRPFEPEE